MGNFLSLAHPFIASDVARVLLDSVVKVHGLPLSITSDRDKIFTSNFWRELFKQLGVDLHVYSLLPGDGWANQKGEPMLRSLFKVCLFH